MKADYSQAKLLLFYQICTGIDSTLLDLDKSKDYSTTSVCSESEAVTTNEVDNTSVSPTISCSVAKSTASKFLARRRIYRRLPYHIRNRRGNVPLEPRKALIRKNQDKAEKARVQSRLARLAQENSELMIKADGLLKELAVLKKLLPYVLMKSGSIK